MSQTQISDSEDLSVLYDSIQEIDDPETVAELLNMLTEIQAEKQALDKGWSIYERQKRIVEIEESNILQEHAEIQH